MKDFLDRPHCPVLRESRVAPLSSLVGFIVRAYQLRTKQNKNKNVKGCGVAKHIDQEEESKWHLGTELSLHHSKSEKHGKRKDQFT